jgi:hypothetical protein
LTGNLGGIGLASGTSKMTFQKWIEGVKVDLLEHLVAGALSSISLPLNRDSQWLI